jgi:membrane-associated protease RseP (regulator of RpoE activity)
VAYPPSRGDEPGRFPPVPNDAIDPYTFVPAPPRRDRVWLPWLLLALTLVTTTVAGGCHYAFFVEGFREPLPEPAAALPASVPEFVMALLTSIVAGVFIALRLIVDPRFMAGGLWFSLTVLSILGCHEMGHYVACLRYRVDATRPYFLPAPLPLTGTLGAFIRIRSRIPSKVALFDIGIAGPIAGFIVAVPALVLGLYLSRLEKLPADMGSMISLGEPLLFRGVKWLVFGAIPAGYDVNMHPMAFAAWFGLLATALNLFPIAQLDGGHISYAVLGRHSLWVTLAMASAAVGLTFVSSSWIAWTVLLMLMLVLVGPRHPPTLDDETPLGAGRLWLALFAVVMLIVCFTPAPLEPFVTGP